MAMAPCTCKPHALKCTHDRDVIFPSVGYVRVHTIKAYRGVELLFHLFTNSERVISFTPWPLYPRRKEFPAHTKQEARWASVPVWGFWIEDRNLPTPGIELRLLSCQIHSLVTMPSALSRIPIELQGDSKVSIHWENGLSIYKRCPVCAPLH
jgi:hypothetical protein